MPLVKSTSNRARQENIRREIDAGKPTTQAVAIAYNVQEREQQRRRAAKHRARKAGR